jgi:acetyl-CoA carboxylase alpha subunit
MYEMLKSVLLEELEKFQNVDVEDLVARRISRYAGLAQYSEK